MPSVTIDAGVLAAPPSNATVGKLQQYVQTLLDWKQLLKEPWISIYMSERASETLIDANLYPIREPLRKLFASVGFTDYSVNDIAPIITRLLELTPYFEMVFKVKDVLYDDVSTRPDVLSLAEGPNMASELARCLLLVALLRHHCRQPILDHAMVIRPWQGQTDVHVRALVHDVEHTRDDFTNWPCPPDHLDDSVWVCESFRDLLNSLDEASVWEAARDGDGRCIAIQIAIYKDRLGRGLNPEWGNWPDYTFGREFVERFAEVCKGRPELRPAILHSMVETLDGQNLSAIHALRTSEGGGASQLTRGTDKGWRRDISRDAHLHYWSGPQGVEFGWVSYPHNDFILPE